MKRAPIVVALVMAAAACKAVGPDYQAEDAHAPASWSATPASAPAAQQAPAAANAPPTSRTTNAPADVARWWSALNDAQLTSLVERAIAANLDVRQAEARVRQARAARGIAGATSGPELDANGAYRRSGTGPGDSPTGSSTANDLWQTGLDASWEIDLFGGVRREIEAADADLAASIEDRRDVLVSIAAEVALDYVDLRGIQQQIAIAQRNLEAQRGTASVTRRRFQGGLVSALDVANSDALVATTTSLIPSLEAQEHQTIYALSVLLAQAPGSLEKELSADGPIPVAPPEVPVGMPADLLLRRPDVRRAQAQVHAAVARIGVAQSDLYPKINLTGALSLQGDHVGSATEWKNRLWSIGPSLTWPIFSSGRIEANMQAQAAIADAALDAWRKTVLVALQDVESALIAFAKEQEHRRALADAVTANRKAVDLSTQLYTQGLTDFLNVLSAQRALFATEDALSQSERSVATDLVALYKALGGGWSE